MVTSKDLTVNSSRQIKRRKHNFKVPFVCGARNLGEALRRIGEGAAMIRTKGEAGSGNIVEAVRHIRDIINGISKALLKYEPDLKATLKKENLTTRDSRVVERKKYGHRKARRSFQFSKR